MAEVEIIRTQIIVVNEVGENSYGDLTFTDKEGKEYKVSKKRRQYFDDVILPGVAVQLNYAKFKGTEYPYNADKVADKLQQAPQSKSSPSQEASSGKPPTVEHKTPQSSLSKDEQIERAVWIKEMGECIRSGDIDKTTPNGKIIRDAYYAEMLRVLGINLKEVQPAKSLVEEAKRLGAKEIRKEDDN